MDIKSKTPDKVNGDVLYYDNEHVYIDKNSNETFTSVTTLIHKYTNPFDEIFWSSYKALEALSDDMIFKSIKRQLLASKKFDLKYLDICNIDEETFNSKRIEIVNSYTEERNKSCERGTRIHAEFENKFYKSDKHSLSKYGLEGQFNCQKNYYELDVDKGVYPEYLIYKTSEDGILKIAGQIDLLIKDGNDIYIYDYKTNKELKKKSYFNSSKKKYECMKFPLTGIMDCNYMHYTLQLSLYAYLLQQINPEFNIKCLKLIHIDHNDKTTEHDVEYMKDTVEKLLLDYKKQLRIESQLNRNKKVII